MHTQDFLKLSPEERVDFANNLLQKESSNHLNNVAKKLGLSPSTFSKVMRDNNNYQYIQSKKKYYKLLSIEEYKKVEKNSKSHSDDELFLFLDENLDELKELLKQSKEQLKIDPKIYSTNAKTITKSIQVNAEIYDQFNELIQKRFPHLRLRELFSQCLVDFINQYE